MRHAHEYKGMAPGNFFSLDHATMSLNMKRLRPIIDYATPPPARARINPKEVAGVVVFFALFFPTMIAFGLAIGHHSDRLTSFQVLLLMVGSSVLAFAIAVGL